MDSLLQRISQLREAKPELSQANGPTKSYNCPTCRDEEGYIERDENGVEVYRFCECRDKNQLERSFRSSKITSEFSKRSFDNFETSGRPQAVIDAYKFSRIYADNFQEIKDERHNSICLLGRPGCGKTHLLMAVCNQLMKTKYLYDVIRYPSVLYFPWVEGFNEIKDDLSQMEEKINRMKKVDVLYIDDMFKGRKEPTQFQIEQMFAVINYRYMEKKPIIISSERDIDEMCDIDEGLGSRINEMCKDFRIILKGGRELNYRLREDAV
ncbi:DnaA ATPase domain-containing protein [Paenibacillus naphthalenovorans]|uniref:DnaA ATPase domain-containing protein n=1 Tax=Paenibacillus naphthalenovorans TaxID=162209 RepID=UPI00094372F4|nr:DnaA/Hda family protein [Paenibacillus naphthalenovorans]